MSEILKWKGEVSFEGTIDQFNAFRSVLEEQPIRISVSELDRGKLRPGSRAGFIPAPLLALERVEKATHGMTRINFKSIKDIAGGIRTPHLHLGDEVILVDRVRFKTVLGEIARHAAERRVDMEEDYYDMIKPVAEFE